MKHNKSDKSCMVKGKSKGIILLKGIVLLLFSLIFSLTAIHAQQAIPASGGNASGTGGSSSYTVGQTVYTTNTGTNGSVAQGVQQPFEISVVTGIDEAKGINLTFSAYPNPTTDILKLTVESSDSYSLSTLTISLYDINGNLIENKGLESNETQIDMSKLTAATYFLNVLNDNKLVKTFQIVKR